MRLNLIGIAILGIAAALPAAAAPAQRWSDPGFGAAANVMIHSGGPHSAFVGKSRGDDRRHRRHRDRRSDGYPYFAGGWGYYPDPNQGWEPDSYNDWWHQRPDRSLPRWVQRNDDCERVYWSGGGWRC